jgi:hypothetical protein
MRLDDGFGDAASVDAPWNGIAGGKNLDRTPLG